MVIMVQTAILSDIKRNTNQSIKVICNARNVVHKLESEANVNTCEF